MQRTIGDKRIEIVQGDLTDEAADAIVNAANSSLLGGGGVDGAIHRRGGPAILDECKAISARQGGCPAGEAVITTGGQLRARHVIHTVGPFWSGGHHGEAQVLASCYRRSLEIATEHGFRAIAFPSISTGAYRYPVRDAARVAVATITGFLRDHADAPQLVRLVLFDAASRSAYEEALEETVPSAISPTMTT